MNEHLNTWLDAYLDGELDAARRAQVEQHLQGCAECRQRLAERHELAALLGRLPVARGLTPEARFVSAVDRRLAPRENPVARLGALGWVLLPLGLLVMLSFIQTTLLLSSLVGFFPGVSQLLVGAAALQGSLAPSGALGAFGGLLAEFDLFGWGWLAALLAPAAIGLVYVGWLAGWWARNQQAAVTLNNQ